MISISSDNNNDNNNMNNSNSISQIDSLSLASKSTLNYPMASQTSSVYGEETTIKTATSVMMSEGTSSVITRGTRSEIVNNPSFGKYSRPDKHCL